MRQLHLVGVTDDKTGLIVAEGRGAKATTYVVPITEELRSAVVPAGRRRRRGSEDEGFDSGSSLSPREIQARLRSGRTVEQVADEAGVGADWVERFAGPIRAEQRAALERAHELRMDSPRRGQSTRTLSESVVRNLLIKGVRLTDEEVGEGWSAYLYRAGEWVVSFRYVFRRKEVTVDWLLDLADNSLVALDRNALALGFVEPPGSASSSGDASSGSASSSESPSAENAAPVKEPAARSAPAASTAEKPAPRRARSAAAAAPAQAGVAAKRASARSGQEQLVRDRRPPGASAPAAAASKRSKTSARRGQAAATPATPAAPAPAPDDEPAPRPRRRRGGDGGQTQLPGVG